ncbi:hypothetical protein F4781DRAFT_432710 [Annulohypoxylon bovei var. microspora]|nr:hypothetical protein F4781DRAFT_432710 [Annulohypoxylon bovei var. microspora]
MARNQQTADLRANLRLVSPLVALPPAGAGWAVSFWVRFGGGGGGGSSLELLANEAVALRVNATEETAEWTRVEFPLGGESRMLQFVFAFVLGDGAESDEVWVDKVAIDVQPTAS